jgi:hypothetical protein
MQFKKHLLILFSLFVISTSIAQEITPVPAVPDLTGMTVPDAAAVLNRLGLRLGDRQVIEWDRSQPENTITAQSPDAGIPITPGMSVAVTVMHPFNIRLIYDDNDFTLINQSGQVINISPVTFQTLNGNRQFAARRWNRVNELTSRECVQLWSVARTAGKNITGCRAIQQWLTTNNRGEHFWMSGQFRVLQEGIERGICQSASTPDTVHECSLYLAPGKIAEDTTEYLYFTYNTDQFLIANHSKSRWLLAAEIRIGDGFTPGSVIHFGGSERISRAGSVPSVCRRRQPAIGRL